MFIPGGRWLGVLCAVLAMASSAGACSLAAESECSGAGTPAGPTVNNPAPTRPTPVDEALWVAGASGSLYAVDGRTNKITATVDVGRPAINAGPPWVHAGRGLLWVYRHDGEILLVDPDKARITRRARVTPARPLMNNTVTYAQGALWIAQPGRLWRVNPAGKVSPVALPADFRPTSVAATERGLWLAGGRRLVRVDREGEATVRGEAPGAVTQLLGTRGGLFAVGVNQSEIWVLDPETGGLRSSVRLSDGEQVGYLLDAGTARWAIGNCGNVMKMTGGSLRKTKISAVSQIFSAAAAVGSLWVADEVDSTLVRVDLGTGQVVARLPVRPADPGDPAFAVIAGRRSVWVVDTDPAGVVHRVDPAANSVVRLSLSKPAPMGVTAVVAASPR